MSEEMENRAQENGQITYANEVISTIVTVATLEVEGISGITGGGAISGIITRGRTPRCVKVDVKGDQVSVDISVSVDYGIPIQKVGRNCQENVRKSIETMTGLKVERVDLHVVSVSFEKENQEQKAIESARKPALEEPEQKPKKSRSHKAKDTQKKAEEEKPAQEEPKDAPQEAAQPEAEAGQEAAPETPAE